MKSYYNMHNALLRIQPSSTLTREEGTAALLALLSAAATEDVAAYGKIFKGLENNKVSLFDKMLAQTFWTYN